MKVGERGTGRVNAGDVRKVFSGLLQLVGEGSQGENVRGTFCQAGASETDGVPSATVCLGTDFSQPSQPSWSRSGDAVLTLVSALALCAVNPGGPSSPSPFSFLHLFICHLPFAPQLPEQPQAITHGFWFAARFLIWDPKQYSGSRLQAAAYLGLRHSSDSVGE